MTARRTFAFVGLVGLVALVALVASWRLWSGAVSSRPSALEPGARVVAPDAAPCRFLEGARLSFDGFYQAIVEKGGAPGTDESLSFFFSMVGPSTGARAVFSSVQAGGSSRGRVAEVAPLLEGLVVSVEVGPNCAVRRAGFSPGTPAAARHFVGSLLQAIDLDVRDAPRWTAVQTDTTGRYFAEYVRGADSLERRKLRYQTYFGFGQVARPTVSGTARFSLSPEWLRRFESDEVHSFTVGTDLMRVTTRVRLSQSARPPEEVATGGDVVWVSLSDALDLGDEDQPKDGERSAVGSLDEHLNLMLQAGRAGAAGYARGLGDWLKSHPEAVVELGRRIKTDRVPDEIVPHLFLALALAGAPGAQDVLRFAMEDRRAPLARRAGACTALMDVASPTFATVRSLENMATSSPSGNGDDELVSRSATLALLGMAGVVGTDTEEGRSANAAATRTLDAAIARGDPALALEAAGNHGGERYVPLAVAHLSDARPGVRRAAVSALRKRPLMEQERLLIPVLAREQDPIVIEEIVNGLERAAAQSGRPLGDGTVTAACAVLTPDRRPSTRSALINLLGTASRTSPEARQALVAHFHREPSAELRRAIGTYVTAEEL